MKLGLADRHCLSIDFRFSHKVGLGRLVAEQTLGNDAMPGALREWMRAERSSLAAHWNLLTRLDAKAVSRWMLDRG